MLHFINEYICIAIKWFERKWRNKVIELSLDFEHPLIFN